jgi:hypothetical protein
MEPGGSELEEALAHMASYALDGRVRYHGSRTPREKHFSLRCRDGNTVLVPFMVAMKGREAVRACIQDQLVAARQLKKLDRP